MKTTFMTDERPLIELIADLAIGPQHVRGRAKLTDSELALVAALIADGVPYREIAVRVNASHDAIKSIACGRRRKASPA